MKSYLEFINEGISRPGRKIEKWETTYFKDGRLAGYRDVDKIEGDFEIMHPKNLTTLEGFPKEIDGDFKVFIAQLTDLKGAPKRVNGTLGISNSGLTSLEGFPLYVKSNIELPMNKLTSLKYLPKEINGNLSIQENKTLGNLKEAPSTIHGFLNVNQCGLTTLIGGPRYAEGIAVIDNLLSTLEGAPMGLKKINQRENTVDLTIETDYVLSAFYKKISEYWEGLFKFMTDYRLDHTEIKTWPEEFINSLEPKDRNLLLSKTGLKKYNL